MTAASPNLTVPRYQDLNARMKPSAIDVVRFVEMLPDGEADEPLVWMEPLAASGEAGPPAINACSHHSALE